MRRPAALRRLTVRGALGLAICVAMGGGRGAVGTTAPHAELRAEHGDDASVRAVLRRLLPNWVDSAADYACTSIGGGVTNHLQHCTAGATVPELLFRIYGEGTDTMINRVQETAVLVDLAERGYPSGLHGTFTNGRVEKFLQGRVLTLAEMRQPDFRRRIATKLALLHQLQMPGDNSTASLWGSLEKWLQLIKEGGLRMPTSLTTSDIRRAIAKLAAQVHAAGCPVRFTHNDAQALNMMFEEETQTFNLVDFEYAGYNYRGFDLANHLQEYAGFGPINWSLLPGKEAQRDFLLDYADVVSDPREADPLQLTREVELFTPASHLFWGLWAVVQDSHSSIDFDYAAYSRDRFDKFEVWWRATQRQSDEL